MGALNFEGAMEQLAQVYSSVVELSTADRMVSGSNPDVPCLSQTMLDRKCIDGESSPGFPRGRREFYH